jgi:hypothetical protein
MQRIFLERFSIEGTPDGIKNGKEECAYYRVAGGLLPAPSPLRTGQDSFPSHGSGPSEANPCIRMTRQLKLSITFAIHIDSQNPIRWRAHGSHNVASFAFPPEIGSVSFLETKHPIGVCIFTGRVMSSFGSQPLSTPLQYGLRFFHHLYTYPQQHAFRLACPGVEGMRLSRSTYLTTNTLGPLYLPVGISPASELLQSLRTTHLPFGSSLSTPLAC